MRAAVGLVVMGALIFGGCDGDGGTTDSGPDASAGDAGGELDSGATDAGGTDSGPDDSGPDDGGPADSGAMDGGPGDSGPGDSGPGDSGPGDSGPGDSGPDVDAGMCVDFIGGPTRPVETTCSPCRLPGPGVGLTAGCSEDAECTDGMNGRCVFARFGGMCSYDECFSDSDCESDELCNCNGSRGGGNACIRAGCHVDADCGGYTCAASLGSCGSYSPPVGYFCHSAVDDCQTDEDCAGSGGPGGFGAYCRYFAESGKWSCSSSHCAG